MNDLLVTIILLLNVFQFHRLAALPRPFRFLGLFELPYFFLPRPQLVHEDSCFGSVVFIVRRRSKFTDSLALLAFDGIKLLQFGLEFLPGGQLFLMLLFELQQPMDARN